MDKFVNEATGHQQDVSNKMQPSTPFDIVASTMAAAQILATRVEVLADRLLGGSPATGARGGDKNPSPSGAFYQMADQAVHTSQRLSDANDALARIESMLP